MGDLKVYFLDVGLGDCTLIGLPDGKFMLVDVYRRTEKGTVDAFKVLRDLLPEREGDKQLLDYLVITHAHDDHIWGIGELAEEFEIGELWAPQYGTKKKLSENYEAFQKVVKDQPDASTVFQSGSRSPVAELAGGKVSVRCFSPPGYIDVEETLDEEEARKVVHENCGVYRFLHRGVGLMLTGDSDLAAWKRIAGYYEDETDDDDLAVLKSSVLHASHHGSRSFVKVSKDDDPWLLALEAIDPEDVVISVGAENSHEHPHTDMLKLYEDEAGKDRVWQTKDSETLVLTVSGEDTYTLAVDETFSEKYGWDDDSDGGSDGPASGSGGSGPSRRRPSTPPPGHEKSPQRAPRRERYGCP